MLSRTLTIQRRSVDMQNASDLIRLAKGFKSVIKLSHGNATANAKSTLSVIALTLQAGMSVTIQADGPDEERALEALAAFLT